MSGASEASTTQQPVAESSNATSQMKLPPGMVLGPDGKPCKICTAWRHWKPPSSKSANPSPDAWNEKQSSSKAKGTTTAMIAALATGGTVTTTNFTPLEPTRPANCPPDVEELGRATWTFLHTTAAYYPEKPTPTQRANMLALLRSLPILYPCKPCAMDFEADLSKHPPEVSGREALSRWLCERHNEVNLKLGKEKFDCSKTDERWRDGPADGSCD
ncbi:hypothetical protein AX16_001358 [Volvariella volvacea WC 439]|nr:hypothetical protein AX16_001358 [Volvariella volvacea WC 439]